MIERTVTIFCNWLSGLACTAAGLKFISWWDSFLMSGRLNYLTGCSFLLTGLNTLLSGAAFLLLAQASALVDAGFWPLEGEN